MAGPLVEQVSRLIRTGVANVTGESDESAAQTEHALHLVRDKLGTLIVQRRRLSRQLTELPSVVAELSADAETAVRRGREDLARVAMAEVASLTSGSAHLAEEIASLDADIALLERAIAEHTGARQTTQSDQIALRALLDELDRLAGRTGSQERQSQEK